MTAVLSRFIPSMKKFGFFISYTHPPPKLSGICLGLALFPYLNKLLVYLNKLSPYCLMFNANTYKFCAD